MKNSVRSFILAAMLAVLALPAFAQRGPGDGGSTGGPKPPTQGTMYYLMNDSCRLVLEAKMSTEDAAALEAAVADFRNIDKQLGALRQQMDSAMRAGDKTTFEQLQQQAQQLQQQQGTDVTTINTLLAKYQADADATMRDCHPTKGGGDNGGGNNGGRGRHKGPGGGDPNPHIRMDAGFFIGHDSCRWDLEAHMSSDDATAFEAAALALQADNQQMRDLMKQLRDAMKAHDSATVAGLRQQMHDELAKIKTDRDAYMQLLTKYADQIGAVRKECWTPRKPDGGRGGKGTIGGGDGHILNAQRVYPNPVNSGATVTLNYELSADAQVNITLNDAMGAVVQQLANDAEVAGKYTVTINTAGLQTGNYYIRIQAGSDVMTQKLAIVQ
jgi:uncharacterized protein YpiB (UPF0302 family)